MRHIGANANIVVAAELFKQKPSRFFQPGVRYGMHRLFVALRPPLAMRRQLLAVMGGVSNARWQTEDQLHLTLRFIGPVDRWQADDIAAVLGTINRPRPTIALAGAGSFDRNGHPHSLWAGIAGDDALKLLRDRIERSLIRAGLAPEPRAFKPHITIARLSRSVGPIEPFLERASNLTSLPTTADAFFLFESVLGSAGPSYDVAARYPLP